MAAFAALLLGAFVAFVMVSYAESVGLTTCHVHGCDSDNDEDAEKNPPCSSFDCGCHPAVAIEGALARLPLPASRFSQNISLTQAFSPENLAESIDQPPEVS